MSAIAGVVYTTPSFMPLSLQVRLVPPQGHPSLCHRDWASHQPFHLWPAKANKNTTKGWWQAKKRHVLDIKILQFVVSCL